MHDRLGVQMEPTEQPNPIVGKDWQGNIIRLTDDDNYVDIDGVYVLDDDAIIAEYIREYHPIKNTYEMEVEHEFV